jgi:aspartate racemase
MKRDIRLGVLAGMGPRSTSPFIEMLLDECQNQYNAKYDIDYPHVIAYSLPTPFYIDREVDDNELSNSIKNGIEHLASTGVDIIAIPCNSAHKYFSKIIQNVNIPVLNIIEETVKVVPSNQKTTILATELTMNTNLYQSGLESSEIQYVFIEDWQIAVNEIITEIKASGASKKAFEIWDALKVKLLSEDVQTIILACTDLSVVINESDDDFLILDSSKELARKLVEEYVKIK